MTTKPTATGFRIKLTPEQLKTVRTQAAKKKMTPEAWLSKLAERVTARFLESDDLCPKDAGLVLNVSKFSILRHYHAGRFPNAYTVNSRLIRIPRGDVEALKLSAAGS